MKQLITQGIILSRTNFGEADRIVTLLTPQYGKVRLMAKGSRRIKSKLAGGIELFSISDVTFLQGKSDVGTLISSRLDRHYGHIVKDISRTMLGYDLIKMLNKATEDEPDVEYFQLLTQAFAALDDAMIDTELIRLWFSAQLLGLGGHTPNLQSDTVGQKLIATARYDFSFDDVAFHNRPDGRFSADHIKLLRLLFADNRPAALQKIANVNNLQTLCQPLVQTMLHTYIR